MKFLFNCFSSLILVSTICGCTGKPVQKADNQPPQKSDEEIQREFVETQAARAKEDIKLMTRSVDVNTKEGLAALKAKDYNRAEQLFLVARKQMDNYRYEYGRRAMILVNLASVYEEKEMYSEAIPLLNKSQKLFIKAYGTKHPTVSITLCKLGDCLSKQKRYEEASFVYRTAVSLMEQGGNDKGEDYKETLNKLQVALRVSGQGLQLKKVEEKLARLGKKGKGDI